MECLVVGIGFSGNKSSPLDGPAHALCMEVWRNAESQEPDEKLAMQSQVCGFIFQL